MSAAMTPGVLVAGSIVMDTIVHPCNELRWGTTTFVEAMERHLGGNGANTARALATLGISVELLGAVGNDDAAEFALAPLVSNGVRFANVERVDLPTAATIVLVNSRGERQFLHRIGAGQAAFREPPVFDHALTDGIQHFHLASLFVLPHLRLRAPEILQRARAAGLTTSLDVNWDPHGEWFAILKPCLPHVDILFLNEDESRMITGTANPAKAAAFLHQHCADIIVQKLSHEGCEVFARDCSEPACRVTAYDVEAVDSTGAGDCFAAGFLSAHLQGASLAEAAEQGNAAGAMSVSGMGSLGKLVSCEGLEKWKRTASRRL